MGIKTDTLDREGKILEKRDVRKIDENTVKKVLDSFLGKQKQIPPIYSAIKVNGKKLYEYARQNREVEVKPRDIEIYSIILNNIDNEKNKINITVSVSKGTYIRTLCEDIASKLDTIGIMNKLSRIKVRRI